jgi:hypothetical protein
MAALNATKLTLLDWAKRLDPKGNTDAIVELLMQTNQFLTYLIWKEGNLPTGHQITVRTGLPTIYWRSLNAGVQSSKSTTAQVTEGCGIMEAYSELDQDLAMLNGNTAEFRLSEVSAFFEAMNQEFAQTFFYGNIGVAQNEFNGLAVRYSSLSAGNSQNIISAGGSDASNQASIWLIGFGEGKVFGIFPKGSKAGLVHKDLGLQLIQNTGGVSGAKSECYVDKFQWKAGIAVADWRYVVRICNIDVSDLTSETNAADMSKLMKRAEHRIPNQGKGVKLVYCMNRTLFEMLDIQRGEAVAAGGGITYKEVDGEQIPYFRSKPVLIVDQLLETESVVS